MDIKLRSLICLGLNEQAIHLWLESLASNEEVVKKYYQPSSFLGSPGWVQVRRGLSYILTPNRKSETQIWQKLCN